MSFEEQLEEIKKEFAELENRRTRCPKKVKLIDPLNLTKKQQMEAQAWDIFELKDKGKTHQQIAWKLGISKRTVLYRIAEVRRTLKVQIMND